MHRKPKHITQQLEAYVDNRLSPEERRRIDEHVATCRSCARHLFNAQRISVELGPVFKTTLGKPYPAPELRQQVRTAIDHPPRRFKIWWSIPGQILNAAGTVAVLGLLIFGAFTVMQGQMAETDIPANQLSLRPNNGGGTVTAVNTPVPENKNTPVPPPTLVLASLGDTLSLPVAGSRNLKTPPAISFAEKVFEKDFINQIPLPSPSSIPFLPAGKIAFSIFNHAGDHLVYETHIINPNGSDHRIFPLAGVSEPALSPDGQHLAYRAWSKPTSPRSLLSSNLEGYTPHRVGGYWEDALPDWSPIDYRLIFSSQRESDRRWRLYTSWGDGSREVELRREGRNPTFAPDGYRFAFESCDSTANRCGLWLGDLKNAEYESYPFLEDPLAQAPDWSPVGEKIVYMANPGGNWDLYLVNSDGSNARQLTTSPAIEGLPVWSPNGEWLAFLSDRGGEWGIWLLHLASEEMQQVISLPGASFTPPAYDSPYGQRNWWDEQLSWSW
jgi:hypothetical protein